MNTPLMDVVSPLSRYPAIDGRPKVTNDKQEARKNECRGVFRRGGHSLGHRHHRRQRRAHQRERTKSAVKAQSKAIANEPGKEHER